MTTRTSDGARRKAFRSGVAVAILLSAVACTDDWTPPASIEGSWRLVSVDGAALPFVLTVDTSSFAGSEQIWQRTLLDATLRLDHFEYILTGDLEYHRLDVATEPDTFPGASLTGQALYDYDDGVVRFQEESQSFDLVEGRIDRRGRMIVDGRPETDDLAELVFVRAD